MTNNKFASYNTTQIGAFYQVSSETVRIWCNEFERHLSPRANPGHRQKRAFSRTDMEVFSLIAMLKTDGMTYQDIHLALDNGQRGVLPDHLEEITNTLTVRDIETGLVVKIQQLETLLTVAKDENDRLEGELEESQRDNLRHEVRAEMLQKQLSKTDQHVKELFRSS